MTETAIIVVAVCIAVLILVLGALLIYQQHFFLMQIQTLVDKTMSQNFESYSRVSSPPPPRPKPVEAPAEDLRALNEFVSKF